MLYETRCKFYLHLKVRVFGVMTKLVVFLFFRYLMHQPQYIVFTDLLVCLLHSSEPIAQDYRTVVCPFIDVIDFENFAYRAQDEGARGAFDWEFFYKRLPLLPEDLKHPAEPFKCVYIIFFIFTDRLFIKQLVELQVVSH